MGNDQATVLAFGGKTPDIHPSVFIADGARIIGDVTIGERSSIWYNAVVRGDVHRVRIGRAVNVQDNAILHVTHDTAPLDIDSDVTIGHGAIVHGCTVEEGCLLGMGSIILDGAIIGRGSLIAAGSVVLQRTEIPEGVLVAGNPAVVKRELSEDERTGLRESAKKYSLYAEKTLLTYVER